MENRHGDSPQAGLKGARRHDCRKLCSLGTALVKFTGLSELNLSRNRLCDLGGLETLLSLKKLSCTSGVQRHHAPAAMCCTENPCE